MPNRTGFQSFVNNELPIGVPGDFASADIHVSVNGGQGQFIAPPAGTTIGVFAWFNPATGLATNYYTPNSFLGFVHRENNGLITQFLGISALQVVPGNMVTGQEQGSFLGQFVSGATAKQKVYADPVTGALTANATGNGVTGSYTGTTVTSGVMTTTDANLTGTAAAVGQVVYGGTLPEGTYIASSAGTGSGTHLWNLANANGTAIPNQTAFASHEQGVIETNYTVSEPVAADATSDTAALATGTGILTIAGTVTGLWLPGQFIAGANIPVSANAQILYQITGTFGVAGTYQTSYAPPTNVANEAMTGSGGKVGVITSWAASA